MIRVFGLLLAAFALLLPHTAALAQSGARVVATVSWVEEWDPATDQWVRIEEASDAAPSAAIAATTTSAQRSGGLVMTQTIIEEPVRFIARPAQIAEAGAIARFGPFRVIDETRAALVGTTDAASPDAFAAMLAAYPGIGVIEFADAAGTSNDLANLRLGRAIRAAGLATHVPAGGSARSGAVELFLAGTRRTLDPGALFAVHSWRDALGREPADFAPDALENRLYLDYYADMGMSAQEARAFYAMTNSVPHSGALWLEGAEMARWIAPDTLDPASPAPASRELPAVPAEGYAASPRWVLARSGAMLAGLGDGPWLRAPTVPFTAPPGLAYADAGAALLDSWVAFP